MKILKMKMMKKLMTMFKMMMKRNKKMLLLNSKSKLTNLSLKADSRKEENLRMDSRVNLTEEISKEASQTSTTTTREATRTGRTITKEATTNSGKTMEETSLSKVANLSTKARTSKNTDRSLYSYLKYFQFMMHIKRIPNFYNCD